MKAIGATGEQKAKAVSMLKDGATIQEVIRFFWQVEAEYFERNKAELYELAGLTDETAPAKKKHAKE
jgi:hypothetical protein